MLFGAAARAAIVYHYCLFCVVAQHIIILSGRRMRKEKPMMRVRYEAQDDQFSHWP